MKRILLLLLFSLSLIQNTNAQDTTRALTASSASCSVDSTACDILPLSNNSNSILFSIRGTFVATIQVEYSADGGVTWSAIPAAIRLNTLASVTSFTATGDAIANNNNFTHVRLRVSAYTSGTANVQIKARANNNVVGVIFGGGGGTIGTVNQGTSGTDPWEVNCTTGCAATTSDPDDGLIATGQTNSNSNSLNMIYDGSVWRRLTFGVAGTASAQVITVQGVASMTKLLVTPDLPALASTSTKQSDGSQKTQVVDGSGNVIGSTSNALDVNIKSGAGSGGTALADEAAFTEGTTSFTPSGGYYKSSITALTTGQGGSVALTPTRSFHVTFYDSSGVAVTPTPQATTNTTAQTSGVPVFSIGSTTAPTAVTTGNNVGDWADLNGRLHITGDASMAKLLVTPDSVALPANQSVNISQINTVTPLMGNGVTGTGSQRVTIASDNTAFSVNSVESGTWTVQPGNTANTTPWLVQSVPGTASGLTSFVLEPAASDNHTNIKNGAGVLYHVVSFNNSATINYLRFYNAATGFNGCNSATNLLWEMHIPANTSDAGFVEDIAQGITFSTGISICVTGAYGQTSTTNATASAISLSVGYK